MTRSPAGRDTDRQRVYDAEEAAWGGTTMTDPLTWAEIEVLAAAVSADPWWVVLGVPAPVVERARADSTNSSADGRRIRLSTAGFDAATVSHELAHHLAAHLPWVVDDPETPHGPRFRAAALRTAMVVGGSLAVDQLATAWHQQRLTVAEWPGAEPAGRNGRALRGAIAL